MTLDPAWGSCNSYIRIYHNASQLGDNRIRHYWDNLLHSGCIYNKDDNLHHEKDIKKTNIYNPCTNIMKMIHLKHYYLIAIGFTIL